MLGAVLIGALDIPDSANTENAINTPAELADLLRGGTTRSNELVEYFEQNLSHYMNIAADIAQKPPLDVDISDEDKALFQHCKTTLDKVKNPDLLSARQVSKGFTGQNETPDEKEDISHYEALPAGIKEDIISFVAGDKAAKIQQDVLNNKGTIRRNALNIALATSNPSEAMKL